MANFLSKLNSGLIEFIGKQHMFFVATADADGRVNLSPKGLDALHIISPTQLIWLNLTGSGNETAAHLLSLNRMTIMMCSFEGSPLILRIYGTAKTIHTNDKEWDTYFKHFPAYPGARQIFDLTIESVQTSCGYAVPLYDFVDQRSRLTDHFKDKSKEENQNYWKEKNAVSIDGKPTGM